jgi:hypothetical protein
MQQGIFRAEQGNLFWWGHGAKPLCFSVDGVLRRHTRLSHRASDRGLENRLSGKLVLRIVLRWRNQIGVARIGITASRIEVTAAFVTTMAVSRTRTASAGKSKRADGRSKRIFGRRASIPMQPPASLKRFLFIARRSFRRLYAPPGQVVRCPRLIAMNLNRGSAADLSQ